MFNKKTFAFALLSLLSLNTFAQTITSSPYSRFGLGELQQTNTVVSIAMGGINNGLRLENVINSQNPASYNRVNLTTFDFGVSGRFDRIANANDYMISKHAAPNYMKMAFPITKKWSASIGLVPFSGTGYESKIKRNASDSITQIFKGTGGLNQFYFGHALYIAKGLSVGVNLSYVFGSIDKIKANEYADTLSYYNIRQTNATYVGSLYSTFGLQYSKSFASGHTFIIGYSGALQSKLNATRSLLSERYYYTSTGYERLVDTVQISPDESGSIVMPAFHSIGLSYSKLNSWLIGLDVNQGKWSQFQEYGVAPNPKLNDTYQLALGGSIIPNYNAVGNYFATIEYRAGFNFTQSYLTINEQKINAIGLSMGFGLPLPKSSSKVNFAVEVGRMGTTTNNLVQEEYLKFHLGFNFSDKWFVKRQYD